MKQKIQNYFTNNYKAFYSKYLPEIKKVGGNEYEAICPFHDDKKPSFNFNDHTGQYFCHGCNKKGDLIHFYAKIKGLGTKHDFGKILRGIANDFGITYEKPHIVKTYDYTDESGNLLFQVLRMEPKSFRQRRPDGSGGWNWGSNGTRRVLYNLPEVLKAQEVIIVEGEKDADTLKDLGFIATTCPMGAGKWQSEYSETLKGKDVILIPDNDNQGKEHMAQVGASLNGIAKDIKWLELPDLPSKGDVSDFLSKFKDKEEAFERLSSMIEAAEPYKPPEKKTLDDIILPVTDFCTLELPAKDTLLHPWLKEQSIILISGWRGVGKSWDALGVLDAISKGKPFGPWECKKSVPGLFLDGEMPPQDVKERIDALCLGRDAQSPLYIYCDALANQWGLPRAHLANEAWRSKMKQILLTHHIKLWVIDNLASLASGLDENKKQDWDPINQWLLELRFAGISTIILHHVGKEGNQRGTSAREDNIDISIILKHPHDYTPEDGARFICHFSKGRISNRDSQLIADMEFKLIQNDSGKYEWTWGSVKKENRRAILELLDQGMDQKTIVENLGLTKGTVSKIRTQALKEGLITPKGKLTQSGFAVFYE
jgi:hypothetical protein